MEHGWHRIYIGHLHTFARILDCRVSDITGEPQPQRNGRLIVPQMLHAIAPAMGFYTRQAHIKNQVDADAQVKAMCGLPPDAHFDFYLWQKLMRAEDRAATDAAVANSLDPRGDGETKFEYTLIGKDGVERRIVDFSRTMFDQARRPVRRTGYMVDITQWKRTGNELKKAAALFEGFMPGQSEALA